MKIKNFNIILVLIAEILVAIYGYVYRYPLTKLAITMGIVFLLFFTVGTILQALSNRLFLQVEEKEAREREEREQEEKRLQEERQQLESQEMEEGKIEL